MLIEVITDEKDYLFSDAGGDKKLTKIFLEEIRKNNDNISRDVEYKEKFSHLNGFCIVVQSDTTAYIENFDCFKDYIETNEFNGIARSDNEISKVIHIFDKSITQEDLSKNVLRFCISKSNRIGYCSEALLNDISGRRNHKIMSLTPISVVKNNFANDYKSGIIVSSRRHLFYKEDLIDENTGSYMNESNLFFRYMGYGVNYPNIEAKDKAFKYIWKVYQDCINTENDIRAKLRL